MNILVVDDTPVILEAIADFLELEGYNPILASSVLEGINLVTQVEVDITIVKIDMMPLNGFDFALAIRNQHKHIPVIFLSSEKNFETLYKDELEKIDNCAVIFKHQISTFIELLDTIKQFKPK